MRRALLVAALVAGFAAPAHGAVIATENVAVGPVLDGAGVTWGTEPAGAMLIAFFDHVAPLSVERIAAMLVPRSDAAPVDLNR